LNTDEGTRNLPRFLPPSFYLILEMEDGGLPNVEPRGNGQERDATLPSSLPLMTDPRLPDLFDEELSNLGEHLYKRIELR